MKSVKLNFLLISLLIFGLSYQGCAECPSLVWTNTYAEANLSKAGKGIAGFFKGLFGGGWDLNFDEKLLQYIKIKAIKDQGIDGYFNPKIRVCDYEGDNCHELYSGTSCQKIYGTQASGAGVSAAVFIDWEGDKTKAGGEIAQGLEWDWADDVTDKEKVKFANSPKICACSQKSACLSGVSATFARWGQGANIFRPGEMAKACDTCSWGQGKQKIKCAPVPLAPGPPPFCEQLAMSPPQVRIVPITDKDNDYFDPKVKVIAGDLIEAEGLDFPKEYGKDKPKKHSISDKDGTTHYFETYREKDKLCAEYRGTEREESKRKSQFPPHCFPAPPAPELEEVEIVDGNTLKIRMKMNARTRTFNINTNHYTNIGPLSLTIINPAIVEKTAGGDNSQGNIDDIMEGILRNNPQFKILEKYDCVPDIMVGCSGSKDFYSLKDFNEEKLKKCKSDNLGQPEIEVKYNDNSKSKMLCLSGWQPEPEEFVLKRESEIIPLKSVGTRYVKYDSVYSKESNQFYYLPSKDNKEDDLLQRPQEKLDEIIFNKQGYVFFPEKNKQEKGKCSYCVNKNDEIDAAFQSGTGLKVVYKLMDAKYGERCDQGQDGCICFNGKCSRSTQYLNKKDDKPFYLRYEEVICKNERGEELKNKKGEAQNCIQLKDQPIKANRTEIFYADKLCMLNLKSIKERVLDIIREQLKNKNLSKPYEFSGDNNYTGNLSKYGYIEIEAWGGGEAGHIKGKAHSTESRPGMPGDYIKAQLKIDPEYSIIRAQATEGGGGLTSHISNKDGGPIFIKMCKDSSGGNCKDLITVAGGGKHRTYGGKEYRETKIHVNNLKLEEPTVVTGKASTQDNQVAYIENGKIKYEAVQCSSASSSNKHGAGGCIDRSSETYGRGSPGYVIIRSVQIDDEEVKKIIDALVENPGSTPSVSDLIEKLHPGITQKIKDEIKRELLGL